MRLGRHHALYMNLVMREVFLPACYTPVLSYNVSSDTITRNGNTIVGWTAQICSDPKYNSLTHHTTNADEVKQSYRHKK